ncbi:MAG: PspA/IM30 family protein [Desulfotalea sp.]
MKEGISKRVGRIVSGSFNAVVDAIENVAPEVVLEQAIREIDDAIMEVKAELGKVIANKHLANKKLMEENKRHEDLSQKIEFAISEAREDLAETAISQQFDIEAQMPILKTTINDGGIQEKELEGYVSALQAKKRQMKTDLRMFRESLREAESVSLSANGATGSGGNVEGKVSRAGSAFDRIMEKATGMSSSSMLTDKSTAAQMAELEDMSRKNRIQERLAAVKGKLKTED